MHRRAVASSMEPPSSSKVVSSRERRAARRGNKLVNGGGIRNNGHNNLPYHTIKQHDKSSSNKKVVLVVAIGTVFIFLLMIWGGTLYHVTTEDESSTAGGTKKKWKIGNPKNALKRMRNGDVSNYHSEAKSQDSTDPYNTNALAINPYLGWQPPLVPSPKGSSFTFRDCFKADAKSDGTDQPAGCYENPSELGSAPVVEDDWIPDVTMIRTMMLHGKDREGNIFPPSLTKELCEDIGVRGGKIGDTNKECVEKSNIKRTGTLSSTTVTINPSNHYEATNSNTEPASIVVPAPKLMCLVYTMADAHANRIRAMRDTWAGGCDGFLAFSTESDPRLPAISLEHEGPEAYENIWQKVRSIWKFVGTHYIDDFDWFFIGGDDLFVLPHNLKTYLASLVHKDGTDPKAKEYFVGRRFNSGIRDYFNSGGAGYTLSQATLRKFLEAMDDAKHCSANTRTSMEDVMIARCLSHLGIHFTDTRDAKGRERFHPFAPGTHLHWAPPDEGQPADWYEQYNKEWGLLLGKDCCAPDSVSFHYVKKASMVRHMQALFYSCDDESR